MHPTGSLLVLIDEKNLREIHRIIIEERMIIIELNKVLTLFLIGNVVMTTTFEVGR